MFRSVTRMTVFVVEQCRRLGFGGLWIVHRPGGIGNRGVRCSNGGCGGRGSDRSGLWLDGLILAVHFIDS